MNSLLTGLGAGVMLLVGVGVVAVLVLMYFIGIYNRLVGLKNRFKNAFAQIDVQLKRRYDLIPNLVETAKGYMKHERETLEAVIAARNTAVSAGQQAAANPGNPQAMQDLSSAETVLTGTMTRFYGLGGELSRSEGQPEHAGLAGRAHQHGEQGGIRPPGVQRRGDDLQHGTRSVSEQPGRGLRRFSAGRTIPGRSARRAASR